jgi:Tol biopolymer transport system component
MRPAVNPKSRVTLAALFALVIAALLFALSTGPAPVGAQNPPGDMTGKSRDVLLVPNSTVDAGPVHFQPDTDHDGMPDADEAQNGTDPNDPSDADADADGDGLSNGDEVAGGSQVNNSDSDGDGVSDGEEVRLGYNPGSGASTPPTSANVVAIQAGPRALGLIINTLFGPRPGHLVVTAQLGNGSFVDITQDPGTTYESLNPSVAAVDSTGTVAGVAPGSTSIVVRRGGLTAQVPATVTRFTPAALSTVSIPGYANNVEVLGNYAYVAAGVTGLQVVDVSDRRNPRVVGALDTNGNADDVRLVGDFAYVADGSAGLKIMSIANRTAPSLAGSLAVPGGDTMDVFISGARAYLACGSAGLRIVDVSNPAAPALLGALDTPLLAHGVSVSGTSAVIADDNRSTPSLVIVDVADARNPRALGTLRLPTNFGGGAKDVETRGTLAYVAGFDGGFFIVDFGTPAAPRVVGSIPTSSQNGFASRDVVLSGDYAVFAEQLFANAVPFILISDPTNPRYRGVIDFEPLADYAGTGIAADRQYVYMTGERFIVNPENGTSGDTRLFIGQYDSLEDNAGLAPTVIVESPRDGATAQEATTITLEATAADDVGVASVQLLVNGAQYGPLLAAPPYRVDYTVPLGATTFSVSATATDFGGNTAISAANTVSVTPDSPPTVRLTSPAAGATIVNGESLALKADATDNVSVSRVVFSVDGAELPPDTDAPFEVAYQVPDGVTSLTVAATATDNFGRAATDSRSFTVVADPLTTVTGSVLNGVAADVTALGRGAQASPEGLFTIGGVPTLRGLVKARAMIKVGGQVFSGASQRVAPVRGGVTDVGAFGLAPVGRLLYTRTSFLDDGGFEEDILTASVDGSDTVNLTPGPGIDYGPKVSPDGRLIAYQSFRGCSIALKLMNLDGSGEKTVEYGPTDYAWSPDGSQLAYSLNENVWNGSAFERRSRIYVTDRLLETKRQVMFSNTLAMNELSWSPDGARILFVGNTEGGPSFGFSFDLYTVNVNSLALTRLTTDAVVKYEPGWSPDGSLISFILSEDAGDNVYVVARNGTGLRKLTPDNYWYYDLAWAAAGTKLAATRESTTGNGSNIVLLDAVTGAEQLLTTDEIYNWRPQWSEDGTQLAFLSDDGMQVVEADGLGQRPLNGVVDSYQYTWLKAAGPAPDPLTTVQGRVVDAAGVPVAGARVRVGAEFTATTAADGTFAVPGVPALEGKVTAFASAESPARVLSGGSTPVTPVPGGVTQAGDVRVAEKLAFLTGRDGNWEVYSADADGTHERRLTNNTNDEFRPSLSPDGTRIAYNSSRSGQYRIHVMNVDGSGDRQITNDCGGGSFDPKWSPDGTKIAFTGRPENNSDIMVINADGTDPVRLTNDPADDYLPDWSPDGTHVLFVSTRDGNSELYVMNADGSGLTRLTNTAANEQEVAWSPDGTKIAFNSNHEGTDAIYVMNTDGTGVTRVTPLDVGSFYAAWSHDGSRIAFSSTRANGWQIWAIKPDGTGLTRVTNNNFGSDFQPDW